MEVGDAPDAGVVDTVVVLGDAEVGGVDDAVDAVGDTSVERVGDVFGVLGDVSSVVVILTILENADIHFLKSFFLSSCFANSIIPQSDRQS